MAASSACVARGRHCLASRIALLVAALGLLSHSEAARRPVPTDSSATVQGGASSALEVAQEGPVFGKPSRGASVAALRRRVLQPRPGAERLAKDLAQAAGEVSGRAKAEDPAAEADLLGLVELLRRFVHEWPSDFGEVQSSMVEALMTLADCAVGRPELSSALVDASGEALDAFDDDAAASIVDALDVVVLGGAATVEVVGRVTSLLRSERVAASAGIAALGVLIGAAEAAEIDPQRLAAVLDAAKYISDRSNDMQVNAMVPVVFQAVAMSPNATLDTIERVIDACEGMWQKAMSDDDNMAWRILVASSYAARNPATSVEALERLAAFATQSRDLFVVFTGIVRSNQVTKALLHQALWNARMSLDLNLSRSLNIQRMVLLEHIADSSVTDEAELDDLFDILASHYQVPALGDDAFVQRAAALGSLAHCSQCSTRHVQKCLDLWEGLHMTLEESASLARVQGSWQSLAKIAQSAAVNDAVLRRILQLRRILRIAEEQLGGSEASLVQVRLEALRVNQAIAESGAGGLELLGDVVASAELALAECGAPCADAAWAVYDGVARSLASPRFAVSEAAALVGARSLLAATAAGLPAESGPSLMASCGGLLRLLTRAPSPGAVAAPALQRAGLTQKAIDRIRSLSALPGLTVAGRSAVAACVSHADAHPDWGSELAPEMLRALCAADPDIRLEAASGFATLMASPSADLSSEDLLEAGRCLAPRAHDTPGKNLALTLSGVLAGVHLYLQREPRAAGFAGLEVLCRVVAARRDEVADMPAMEMRSFASRFSRVCGTVSIEDT
mmetsp:Transcript_123606/g.357497  ORF Transcript_123606/g.357497 Transcript_123606/m.357497 type:complete len:795 (+) Transcript_123606:61-2445(+)